MAHKWTNDSSLYIREEEIIPSRDVQCSIKDSEAILLFRRNGLIITSDEGIVLPVERYIGPIPISEDEQPSMMPYLVDLDKIVRYMKVLKLIKDDASSGSSLPADTGAKGSSDKHMDPSLPTSGENKGATGTEDKGATGTEDKGATDTGAKVSSDTVVKSSSDGGDKVSTDTGDNNVSSDGAGPADAPSAVDELPILPLNYPSVVDDPIIELHDKDGISSTSTHTVDGVRCESWEGSNIYVTKRSKDKDIVILRSRYSKQKVLLDGYIGTPDPEDSNPVEKNDEVKPDKLVPLDAIKVLDHEMGKPIIIDKTPDEKVESAAAPSDSAASHPELETPTKDGRLDIETKTSEDDKVKKIIYHHDLVDHHFTPSTMSIGHFTDRRRICHDPLDECMARETIVLLKNPNMEPIRGSDTPSTDIFYLDRLGMRMTLYGDRLDAMAVSLGCYCCKRPVSFPPYRWEDKNKDITIDGLEKAMTLLRDKFEYKKPTTKDAIKLMVRDPLIVDYHEEGYWTVTLYGHRILAYQMKGGPTPMRHLFLVCSSGCLRRLQNMMSYLVEEGHIKRCIGCDGIIRMRDDIVCSSECSEKMKELHDSIDGCVIDIPTEGMSSTVSAE